MNWGNKLLLTFIAFGAGMFFLVYGSLHTNYELVEKDYYKSELRYQQVIDGTNRVNQLSTEVKIMQTAEGVVLQLPEEFKTGSINGDSWFYCVYDEKRDRKFPLQLNADAQQVFSNGSILPGKYTVKISWNSDGKFYFSEKLLIIK